MRPVILNADDYGMDGGVDDAILALAARGIVTAASAMVLSPSWPEAGRRLLEVEVDRGLHLDLTSTFAEPAASPHALPQLMGAAYLGRLDRARLGNTIERQLDRFDAVIKAPPHFVDGHQHVHQLPLVREELLSALKWRYGAAASGIAVRLCAPRRWRGVKASIIGLTGAGPLARLLAKFRHPANTDFAGVYDFSPRADLASLWRGWLAGLTGERPLIMCHVASREAPGSPPDPIRGARLAEWQWLGSARFRELCAEFAVTFGRWRIAGTPNG